ncbi:MAG: tetratricopeptide repeat protein, partial [bacterium]|nr:tetratricopeptide repeat protein [bacterium]
ALLIFVDVPSVTGIVPAGEVVLDHATTWEITRSTISDRTLFGTGPENFLKAFVDYRPEAFNDRGLWNLTFIKGSSEFLQLVVTTGILTTLVLLYLLFRHGWSLLRSLISKSDDQPEWFLQLSIWLGWLMVVVLIFFYPFNFVLHFTLWFLMALGISLISESRPQTIEAGSSVSAGFLTSIAFSLIVVLGVVFVYGAGKIWFAEYEFGRGSQAGRSSDYTEAQARFAKAVSLNGRDANFRFALAQSYLNEALALDPEASDSVNRFSELASQAVVEARAALDQSQSNPVDYKSFINLYMILAQVNPIVRADLVPIYDELTVQDPKNPLHWIEAGDNLIALGQLALASLPEDDEDQKAQMIGQANEYFNQAREKYASASELKTDYVIALLKKALVLELIDDTAGAITEIQSLVESYPESVETRYELGRLYQSTEDVEAAKSEYITVLNLSPEHANAAFSLAEISEQQGDTESAVALYSRVLQNNPDNEVVRERLEALGVEIVDEREGASLPSEEEPESIE